MKIARKHIERNLKGTVVGEEYIALGDTQFGSVINKILEQKKIIAGAKKTFPNKLDAGKWYTLLVTIKGDLVTASIDGKEIASVKGAGFAHPTKRMLRLSVPKSAVVDDVKITSLAPVK